MTVSIYQLAHQLHKDIKSVRLLIKQHGIALPETASTLSDTDANTLLQKVKNNNQSAHAASPIVKKSLIGSAPVRIASPKNLGGSQSVTALNALKKNFASATLVATNSVLTSNQKVVAKQESTISTAVPTTKDAVETEQNLIIKPPVTLTELANLLKIKPFTLIKDLMDQKIFASIGQVLDENTIKVLADKYNFTVETKRRSHERKAQPAPVKSKAESSEHLEPRQPIVCILGHVDHGKTTLLDTLRKANVAAKEAGGITQHIGAYQVEAEGKKITFLDTPGHAVFSNIRQRGATVTDIIILVVAADDGFMPQTKESLQLAQKENVPVVVAINKMDVKGANIDRIKQQMQANGIAPEEWGGDTLCTEISALKGTNLDKLLQLVLLQAEMMELKANPKGAPEGVVVESRMEEGQGIVTTAIITSGTLKPGDALVSGTHVCKVRCLLDEHGKRLTQATPATPVQITGWVTMPSAGCTFRGSKNEKEARKEAEACERELRQNQSSNVHKISNIDDLMAAMETKQQKTLQILLRSDVHGSLEALEACLKSIHSDKVALNIVDMRVGQITLNDIQTAHAGKAIIVGFNTKPANGVLAAAKQNGVRIIQHNIIYELIEQVKNAMRELLEPEWSETKLGSAEIRKVITLSKGTIAGCMVVSGQIVRDAFVRLIRKGTIITETKSYTLKHFKNYVSEVKSGNECGIGLEDAASDCQEGDLIECYKKVSSLPEL